MIHIENNQNVPENENLRVLSQSGDYSDNDLIECYDISSPGVALVAFSASFIKYGGVVYKFSNPELLGEELVKIDPQSTHDAAVLFREEDTRRKKREKGDYTPENPVPADESVSQIAQEAQVEQSQNTDTTSNTGADTANSSQSSPSQDQTQSNTSDNSSNTNGSGSIYSSNNSVLRNTGSGAVAGQIIDTPSIDNITSTSTPDSIISTNATSTDANSSVASTSTTAITTNNSNTSSSTVSNIAETATNIVDTATSTVQKISDVIENIIDASTGSSTPN